MTFQLDERAVLPQDIIDAGLKQLAEGHKVVYPVSNLPAGEFVRQYPDGRKMVVKLVDGQLKEVREYRNIP